MVKAAFQYSQQTLIKSIMTICTAQPITVCFALCVFLLVLVFAITCTAYTKYTHPKKITVIVVDSLGYTGRHPGEMMRINVTINHRTVMIIVMLTVLCKARLNI